MKRRLVMAHEAIALVSRLRLEVPVNVLMADRTAFAGLLFLKCIDFDEFVSELNELCYRCEHGGDA